MKKISLFILVAATLLTSCHPGFHFEKRKYRSGWYRGGNAVEAQPYVKEEKESRTNQFHPDATPVTAPVDSVLTTETAPVPLKKEERQKLIVKEKHDRIQLHRNETAKENIKASIKSSKKNRLRTAPKPWERGELIVRIIKIVLVSVLVVLAILFVAALVAAASDALTLLLLLILFIPAICLFALLLSIILSM